MNPPSANLPETHIGWNTDEHLMQFDHWNKMNNFEFVYKYGAMEDQKYLTEKIKNLKTPSILDFGCATGTTNRYLRLVSKKHKYTYKGVDISKPIINQAKKYYGEDEFEVIGKNSDYLQKNKFDIVISRDTVLHQEDPYKFIKSLLQASNNSLILRTKTRDNGETVFDVSKTCQLHYDNYWMPYIVLNFDELIEFLLSQERVDTIKVNKSYFVLGGHLYKYLPKELYFKKAGGSDTALIIDLSDDLKNCKKEIKVENKLEGDELIKKKRIKTLFLSASSRFIKSPMK